MIKTIYLAQYYMNPQQQTHILFVSNSAWSVYNFRLDIVRYLMEQGIKVTVLAPEDDHAEKLQANGCHFIPVHFNNRTTSPLEDYRLYRKLSELYKKLQPDFIFHYVAKSNIYGSMAAARNRIPSVAVVTGLGYPFARRNWLFYLVRLLYKRALNASKEVWFLNNEDARVFVDEKIIPIEKAKVLPGEGVNTSFFMRKQPYIQARRPFRFLMSTRLLYSKGIKTYADAARILIRKGYEVDFSLIGFFEEHHPDSISKKELEKWTSEGYIKYHGYAQDVRGYLENADCFVFPSYYQEGIPRCLMEAASMELPIVTTDNRGCREVVENFETGFLCNKKDPFDLADKMEQVINLSAHERQVMGKKGRALVTRKFNVEDVIRIYVDTIQPSVGD